MVLLQSFIGIIAFFFVVYITTWLITWAHYQARYQVIHKIYQTSKPSQKEG